jgi:hypothetical protein
MEFWYLPILKWKQGEQHALRHFTPQLRPVLLPLIELINGKPKSGVTANQAFAELVAACAKELAKNPANSSHVAIDVSLHPLAIPGTRVKTVAQLCSALSLAGVRAIPVVTTEMIYTEASHLSSLAHANHVVLRISPTTLLPGQIPSTVAALHGYSGAIHGVLDLGALVGMDPSAVLSGILPYLAAFYGTKNLATHTLAGGSFPYNLEGIKKGTRTLSRVERIVWLQARAGSSAYASLKFGDYAVTHPKLMDPIDPRTMNPAAQIRYARHDDWLLFKASGSKTAGMAQYNQLCKLLVAHADYAGQNFCYGDARYHAHAQPGSSTGSYMTWRRDATSHHIELTLRDCLPGAP